MFFGRMRLLMGGMRNQDELLDRPLSNYDVIGIPTGEWSSGMFDCFQNLVPSCILSFFCPCIMWAQIVVRAQIPLLIGLKNSLSCLRTTSGYGVFIDFFIWSAATTAGLLILIIVLYGEVPSIVTTLFCVILVAVCLTFLGALAHTREAFREK